MFPPKKEETDQIMDWKPSVSLPYLHSFYRKKICSLSLLTLPLFPLLT